MRKTLRFFASLMAMMLAVGGISAQAPMPPQLFTYQAVVRDGSNHIVRNATVGVQITIMQSNPTTGTQVYQETHSATTNVNGAFTVIVGSSATATGTIAAIDWSNGPYYLVSQVDINNDLAYDITTTQQLVSVPYALYCETCANCGGGGGSYTETQGLSDVVAINNSANNNQLKNLKDPTDPQDAMTKRIIDSITHRYDSILAALTACCGGGGGGSTPCAASAGTVNISGTAAICSGSSTTLTANTTGTTRGALTYQWQKNGTNIVGATNSTYTATTAGTYTVIVTATDASCTPTTATSNASQVVTTDASNLTIGAINVDQGAGATPMTSLTVTAGDEADVSANVLTSSVGGRLGYAWGSTRGDNAWCQTSGRHFTAGNPGSTSQTMTLYLRVFDTTASGCTAYKDTNIQITINPSPNCGLFSGSSAYIKSSLNYNLRTSALNVNVGDAVPLDWYAQSGSFTSNEGVVWTVNQPSSTYNVSGYTASKTYTFNTAGTYEVTATMTYDGGCQVAYTTTVTVAGGGGGSDQCPSSSNLSVSYNSGSRQLTLTGIENFNTAGWSFNWYQSMNGSSNWQQAGVFSSGQTTTTAVVNNLQTGQRWYKCDIMILSGTCAGSVTIKSSSAITL